MYAGVILGLGNPGPQYEHTRHNCGFDTLDFLLSCAASEGSVYAKPGSKFTCLLWDVDCPMLKGRWLVAKPLTFMNESGRCAMPLLAWHKLPPEKLIVIHDELDIPVGEVRFKYGGGNAGHNGLKSITACLGTNNFYRLRIGIDKPRQKQTVIDWVLGRPKGEEADILARTQEASLDVLESFVTKGLESAVALARTFKPPLQD